MSTEQSQAAPPSAAGITDDQTRQEFLAAHPPPLDSSFLDERTILARVPVSRRTWGNWKAKGLIPYIKIGRRCLYDWENVANALRRMERGGGQ